MTGRRGETRSHGFARMVFHGFGSQALLPKPSTKTGARHWMASIGHLRRRSGIAGQVTNRASHRPTAGDLAVQQRRDLLGLHRPADQETLREVAVAALQEFELGHGLHPFGRDLDVEVLRHRNGGAPIRRNRVPNTRLLPRS